jgi:hypothetical protein
MSAAERLRRGETEAVIAARLRDLGRAIDEQGTDATTAVRSTHEELEELPASAGERGDHGREADDLPAEDHDEVIPRALSLAKGREVDSEVRRLHSGEAVLDDDRHEQLPDDTSVGRSAAPQRVLQHPPPQVPAPAGLRA